MNINRRQAKKNPLFLRQKVMAGAHLILHRKMSKIEQNDNLTLEIYDKIYYYCHI
jgi:hypothetical protein